MQDQRTISMPYKVYNDDLNKAGTKSWNEAIRRFLLICKLAKSDPKEAILMIVEDFEGSANAEKIIEALGLTEEFNKKP